MADYTAIYDEFWKIADTNKDGALTLSELKFGIQEWRPEGKPKGTRVPTDDYCSRIFNEMDYNGDQRVTKAEFVMVMLTNPQKRHGRLATAFKDADTNGDGFLTPEEVKEMIVKSKLFKKGADEIADEIVKNCDTDKNGKISYDEYVAVCDKH